MTVRLVAIAVLILVGCRGGEASTSTTAAPTTTVAPTTRVTLLVPAIEPPTDDSFEMCSTDLEQEDWPLTAAVALPGFGMPDGSESAPGQFRLLAVRGEPEGYADMRSAEEAAFSWLPFEGSRESRGIVLGTDGRLSVFQAARYTPGEGAGVRTPCVLAQARVVAWYGIQAVGPPLDAELYWVWQENDGAGIHLARLEG